MYDRGQDGSGDGSRFGIGQARQNLEILCSFQERRYRFGARYPGDQVQDSFVDGTGFVRLTTMAEIQPRDQERQGASARVSQERELDVQIAVPLPGL
ncbi:hypothetical protein ABH920_000603 [Catenulispora sp. EB89]|uniref:hypothetical protein n=1 Tax=Catenulispora sp. EB89 TaxID=3156257 RepID=UPI003513315A